jgi:O-antigen ligase
MIRHSRLLLTVLLTGVLLWAPLPFGGVTPWAVASLQVLAFLALALAALAARPAELRPVLLPAAALAGVALFGLVQSLAWPAGLVAVLSPGHAELARGAASLPGVEGGLPHLSLAPAASRSAALVWAAVAGAVLAGGLFQVLLGARNQYLRSLSLWGVEIPASPRLHGTFVNPNHAAAYLEIGLAVAFAWGWWAARRARDETQIEHRILLLAGPCLFWLTLFIGLALSGSRGGLLAAVAAVTAQGLLAASVRGRWRWALLGLGAAAAGGLVVVATVGLREGLGRVLETHAGDVSWGARLTEYAAVLQLWRRFPVTGAGLGAFRDAFPLVQPESLQGTWWHAHSDLLELLATAGVPGVLLLVVGAAALVRRLFRVLQGQGRSEDRAAALALLGALTALAVHEMLDFGLTMPANAVTLAVLAGAAATASTAGVVRRRISAEPGGARDHAAAGDALDLEKVEPRPERGVQPEQAPRPRRKRPRKRSVQP